MGAVAAPLRLVDLDDDARADALLAAARAEAERVYRESEWARAKLDLVIESPYIPVEPHPKQALALMDSRFELLFGGAVAGGKSAYLLMEGLAFATFPWCSSLILRREMPMLGMEGGLIELAHEWLDGTDAIWSEQKKRWTFPRGGKLQFGYLDNAKHLARYKGPAFQFIGLDELTDWREQAWYTFLVTRMRRRKTVPIPLRLRATTNPDGPGTEWVRQRFIDTSDPKRGYLFASIYDNPYINRREYIANMRRVLTDDAIARLIEGNWDARPPGELFRRDMFGSPYDKIPAGIIIEATIRSWDLAATENEKSNWTVGTKWARDNIGNVWVLDVQRFRLRPAERDLRMARIAADDGRGVRQVIPQDPGQAGVSLADSLVRMLAGYPVDVVRESGDKWTRAQPMASMAGRGMVKLVRGPWIPAWLAELEGFKQDGSHGDDDQVDSASLGFNHLAKVRRPINIEDYVVGGARRKPP